MKKIVRKRKYFQSTVLDLLKKKIHIEVDPREQFKSMLFKD